MGMDGVEIVMAVEDAFDIRIEDSEAEKVITPHQLIELVASKVSLATPAVCLTHRAFNLLRKAVLRNSSLARAEIAPATSLSALVLKKQRRAFLDQITAEMGIKERLSLARPNWLITLVVVVSVLPGLGVVILFRSNSGFLTFSLFAGVVLATGILGAKLTNPFCTVFPEEVRTVGDLSKWMMALKSDLSGVSPGCWTREQIAARVREIVVDVLGCEKTYREDARFVEDLGLS